MKERWRAWAARNRANIGTGTRAFAVGGAVAVVGLFAAFDDDEKPSARAVMDRSQEVGFLGSSTQGKWVKRTLRVQDARVSHNGVQVSGEVVTKRKLCRVGVVTLSRTDAAGTIVEGPIGFGDVNKKGAWSVFGPTTITSADRFVVKIKKGILVKTKEGKFNCTKATTAPFAPTVPPGTVPPGAP